jgi:hypothetical protein
MEPNDEQRAALVEFKDAAARALDLLKASCPAELPSTPTGRLAAMHQRLDAMLQAHIEADGPTVFAHACKMGLEGIVSKRKDSRYRSGRSPDRIKSKNPNAPAVRREAEEDWGPVTRERRIPPERRSDRSV